MYYVHGRQFRYAMKKYLIPCTLIVVLSCDKGEVLSDEPTKLVDNSPVIEIVAPRTEGNIYLDEPVGTKASAIEYGVDITVNSHETVILPMMRSKLWLGNVFKANSIADCEYVPVNGNKKPIVASTSLYGVPPTTIERPSLSSFHRYLNDIIEDGNLQLNEESNFAITQFGSYNELKRIFGSNVNTNYLLFEKDKNSGEEELHIQAATGICVKFYQTSFKVFMDNPDPDYMPNISQDVRNSSVYVNSITYGRLGILTMETNYAVDSAVSYTNKIIKSVLFKKDVNFTKEEKDYINSCNFRLFLVGGEGEEAVITFNGLDAFMEYVRKDTFTVDNPGVPILCTFNNLWDDSPFTIKFSFRFEKDPIYARLVADCRTDGIQSNGQSERVDYSNMRIEFFRNEALAPTIAPADIEFKVEVTEHLETIHGLYTEDSVMEYSVWNTGKQTYALFKGKAPAYIYYPFNDEYPFRVSDINRARERRPRGQGQIITYRYSLVPTNRYHVIGLPYIGDEFVINHY